jgi:YegS/Rv2252/BmrU family lipid kinase
LCNRCISSFPIKETTLAGQEFLIAQDAVADGATAIFVAGGDGSVNKTIPALLGLDNAPLLGILPWGTVNLWARDVRIPKNPELAIDTQLAGQAIAMDVGSINNRYFRNVAGIGLDGDVINILENHKNSAGKRQIRGALSYTALTALKYLGNNPTETNIIINGNEYSQSAIQTWIGNMKLLAYMELRPEARCDDGLLEVTVFPKMNLRELARNATPALKRAALSQPGDKVPDAKYYQGSHFVIVTREPRFGQIDGERLDKKPTKVFEVTTIPGSLKVLVPDNSRRKELFTVV